MKQLMIKKFGGTSVGSVDRILAVAQRIEDSFRKKEKMVVVVSAMSGETNRLIQLARQIDSSSTKGVEYDMLLASGEQVSISLLALALKQKNIPAVPLLAHQVGIQTDSLFSSARIQSIQTDLILKHIQEGKVPLIAGFQGVTQDNQITTLGRGGSDTTAVALAVALQQPVCEIYTDVPNIYTADPRLISKAVKIPQLNYEEMMEMAILGSKVLHFRCVELASKFNVKIHLRSTFEQKDGTWILSKEEKMESPVVSTVIQDSDVVVVKLFPIPMGVDFITQVFQELSKQSIMVDVISQSYNSEGQRLAFSVKQKDESDVKKVLSKIVDKEKISIIKDVAKVSIVGMGMATHSGVASQFFKVLNKCQVNLHLVTTSEIKISAIIDNSNVLQVLEQLHQTFCEKGKYVS